MMAMSGKMGRDAFERRRYPSVSSWNSCNAVLAACSPMYVRFGIEIRASAVHWSGLRACLVPVCVECGGADAPRHELHGALLGAQQVLLELVSYTRIAV
jgi:hypothetical protein